MKKHTNLRTGFGHILRESRAIGLTKDDARHLAGQIHKWIGSNSYTGGIDHLDSLGEVIKDYLFHTGSRHRTKRWIKTDKSGFPSSLWYLRHYDREVLKRLIKMKNLICLEKPTKRQCKKFLDAVQAPALPQRVLDGVYRDLIHGSTRHLLNKARRLQHIGLGTNLGLYAIKAIGRHRSPKATSVGRKAAVMFFTDLLHVEHLLDRRVTHDWWRNISQQFDSLPSSVNDFIDFQRSMNSLVDQATHDPLKFFVGNIGATQEPGGKLRCFASPRTIYQMWFTPLFKYLEYFLEQIPQDCHKDQSEGALWAASQLAKGTTLHSIDLSNATDKFPYALQRMVLNQIGIPTEIVGLLDAVVRGEWKAPRELNESVIWSVGQPLGLLPSFALFSLTHHMLVRGVYMKLGIQEDLWDYRILGDDVIIANGRVAALYKEALAQLGVEISVAKSYTSDVYAEFAGYSISPDGSFRPGKFRPATESNIVDKIRNAVDPTVYVPETLLAKELIDEPYPYGLRPPTDDELERMPFESLLAIHSSLKPTTNEWALEFVMEEFAHAFLTTRKESVHRKVEELEARLALWPSLSHAAWENINPWFNIPNILADIQYLCLMAHGEPLEEIRSRLQERFQEDMSKKTRVQLCKYIAMMNPSFNIPQGTPTQMKQLNALHRVLGMQFTCNQLARWLT